MDHFLKNGDEVVADNVKLVYKDGVFKLPIDALDYVVKYVLDKETKLECEVLFKENDGTLRPYYDKPPIN